ncbi:6-phosphogluconolactonase [Aquabacterium sp. CECT 9606]|uniref:6-phosphogluconolactonase n=1 Tax=Aquabacterium sp. CECT 9606 TaxID=2845822 RepID=UPI001E333092|nr:6-phosphogluconolactonase [Aquabacterium sp. CECT 9606]CAH0354968.1 Glucosamine-6-phosphate deaminase [Aquabacterium sp. CECT 9606]
MPDAICHVHEAPDALTLAQDLARFVAERLQEGVSQRGAALLVVSGGSTPIPFFKALALTAVDWPKVSVTLADERWLPPDHADSNERLVRAHLLQGLASQARFVPLKTADALAAHGVPELEVALQALPWPADVVVLGMGSDGHTASLFPGSAQLAEALDDGRTARCLAVSAPLLPNVPVDRVSLSKRALLDTRQVVIHITGLSKRQLLEQAMRAGLADPLPITLAWSRANIPCQVFYSN